MGGEKPARNPSKTSAVTGSVVSRATCSILANTDRWNCKICLLKPTSTPSRNFVTFVGRPLSCDREHTIGEAASLFP